MPIDLELKRNNIVIIHDSTPRVIEVRTLGPQGIKGDKGSPADVSGSLSLTGSLSVSGSVVDFTNVVAISGSIFSGSFVGDGSGLTNITADSSSVSTKSNNVFVDFGTTDTIHRIPMVTTFSDGFTQLKSPISELLYYYRSANPITNTSNTNDYIFIGGGQNTAGGIFLNATVTVENFIYSDFGTFYIKADDRFGTNNPLYPAILHLSTYGGSDSKIVLDTTLVEISSSVNISGSIVLTNITASGNISGSFIIGDGSRLTNISASYIDYGDIVNTPTLISSSTQIATDISGAFGEVSSSLSDRITTNEIDIQSLTNQTSSYVLNSQTSSMVVGTASYVEYNDVVNKPTLVSGSSQISYSGITNIPIGILSSSNQIATDISGAFNDVSASLSDRITIIETQDIYSGSFSGSFVGDGSGLTGVTSTLPQGILSSSAQIATDISGAFNDVSASLSDRITTNETNIQSLTNQTSSYVLNSQTSSMSVATASYVDFNNIDNKPTLVSGSSQIIYNEISNIPIGILSSSVQIATDISGAFDEVSASLSGRITTNETNIQSLTDQTSSYVINNGGDSLVQTVQGTLKLSGDIIAENYIISSSVTYMTQSFSSGSTIFGDTLDDTHQFTGSVSITGSITISDSLTANGLTYPDTTNANKGWHLESDGNGNIIIDRARIYADVKNVSGVTLQKGTPVHVSSSVGNLDEVIAASASNPSTMPATFVLAETLSNEQEGLAILTGFINNVDTSQFGEGEVVYVAPNGGYTNQKPTGSNQIQNLGIVTKVDVNGSGFIYGSGRSNDTPNLLYNHIFFGSASNQQYQTHISSAIDSVVLNNITASGYISSSLGFIGSGASLTNITASVIEYDNILNKPTLISSSAQIATDISGAFDEVSSSLSDRITTNEVNITSLTSVTASYVLNSQTSSMSVATASYVDFNNIDNKPTLVSSSAQISYSDITDVPVGILSSSTQIQSEISGAFNSVSSSLSIRITTNETNIQSLTDQTSSYVLNSQTSSMSVATASYVDFNNIDNKPTLVSGSSQISYNSISDVPIGILSSSAQIASEISGAFDEVSASLSSRITTLENKNVYSGSFSGSFEGNGTLLTNVTASYVSSSVIVGGTIGEVLSVNTSGVSEFSPNVTDATGTTSAAFVQRALYNGSGVIVIDWFSNELIYTNSRTALNWGTDGIVSISGSSKITGSLEVIGNSNFKGSITTKTTRITSSTYLVKETDYRLGVRYTETGSCTISLPLISSIGELDLRIKDEGGNSDLNNITINASGSDTIDGSSNAILDRDYIAISLYNDGINKWFIE